MRLKTLFLLTAAILSIASMAGTVRQTRLEHPKWTYLDRGHEDEVKQRVAHWWDHRKARQTGVAHVWELCQSTK
jgi:hypothetical protein